MYVSTIFFSESSNSTNTCFLSVVLFGKETKGLPEDILKKHNKNNQNNNINIDNKDYIDVENFNKLDKIFEQNKNIKGIKAAAPKVATPFKGISSLNSNAHLMNSGLLTEQEIQNLRTQFINDDIKLNENCRNKNTECCYN